MHHRNSEAKAKQNTDGARGLRPRMFAKTYEENYFSTLFFDPSGQKSKEENKD